MGSGAFLVEACRQLSQRLKLAWERHRVVPTIPPDEDLDLHAMRVVVQRCLYGVDKNPVAVDLAKLSLWLATLAKDHAFTFLDHALRCGDSLVGLSRKQICEFTWESGNIFSYIKNSIDPKLQKVGELRARIQQMGESANVEDQRALLLEAETALEDVRLIGDSVIAAFFSEEKEKKRKEKLDLLGGRVLDWLKNGKTKDSLKAAVHELKTTEKGIVPFHWEIEFPEVFTRENPGFDAMVGNPPFLGGKRISTVNGEIYRDWLIVLHEESNSNSDLVAHFFRRAFNLVRHESALALIATNTVAQGDTRATGLRYICKHGGSIFVADRRVKWPGLAAVIVSIVHIIRGNISVEPLLDGKIVDRISAYLFPNGGDDSPRVLSANSGMSFQGCILRGLGFTFDDTNPEVTSIAEMNRLISDNPRNRNLIFPYIGGEEVNESPTHSNQRYTINFGSREFEDAKNWPDLLAILQEKVKPEREKLGETSVDRAHKQYWWRFANDRPEMMNAIRDLDRVLVTGRVSQYANFAFLPAGMVYSEQLVVIANQSNSIFSVLQSRPHELWARFFGSTLEDRLRYTPTDCFETFPFPENWEKNETLERVGKEYYEYRAQLMIKNNEGLTKTYNRFHDPEEKDPEILKLRGLHAAMDRAVLDAYNWQNIRPTCEFILDYEEDDDEDEDTTKKRRKKKPWRYRWPDSIRDDVLARLLALNRERAEKEKVAGEGKASRKGKKGDSNSGATLFDIPNS